MKKWYTVIQNLGVQLMIMNGHLNDLYEILHMIRLELEVLNRRILNR